MYAARRRRRIATATGVTSDVKSTRISLYRQLPHSDFSLEDTIRLTHNRLSLLTKMDTSSALCQTNGWLEFASEFMPSYYLSSAACEQVDRKEFIGDQVSHFMLRAFASQTPRHFKWFIATEVTLLRTRMGHESPDYLIAIAEECGLDIKATDEAELVNIRDELLACHPDLESSSPIFKVPFCTVLDLVSSRRVFLAGGYAFVPAHLISSIILSKYRTELELSWSAASTAAISIESDGRFTAIRKQCHEVISRMVDPPSLPSHSASLSMDDLHNTAKGSFPLCMSGYASLIATGGRLDHTAFLQYTTFLRTCGGNVDAVCQYFRAYYEKVGRGSDVRKKTYDIRHIFGLEGHRSARSCYSCRTIVLSTDQGHGCPYRTNNKQVLHAQLVRTGIDPADATSIVQMDTFNHCQLACGRVFDLQHNTPQRTTRISYPADFYGQSYRVREEHAVSLVDWDEPMSIP